MSRYSGLAYLEGFCDLIDRRLTFCEPQQDRPSQAAAIVRFRVDAGGESMGKTALVVGGTAATGLAIVEELKQRDFEVTIYHRGAHEVPGVADLEHIHGEPHFAETIASDLGDRSWDVVVATYGRIRYLAEALRGKTQQLVTVGGTPVQRRVPGVPNWESDGYNETENKLIQRML